MQPPPDPITDWYWQSGADGRLRFLTCADCGYLTHPAGPVCARCLSGNVSPQPVSGLGTVLACTVNVQQWNAGQQPYSIAIVALDEQDDLRVTTNVVDTAPDRVKIGDRVRVAFLHRNGCYYPLFRTVEGD
jgi:uncharacterized OB-fold protein